MFVLNLLTAALSLMPSLLAQSRIECSSLNVDSTRQFNNCVSRTLGSAGSISATDQFASCNSLAGSQLKYLSCICQRSDELTEWYVFAS